MATRTDILREADLLINGERQQTYGPAEENFRRIAIGWSVILDKPVTPEQVARMMAWLKLARLSQTPHPDGYIDACGYIALAGELAGA